MDDKAESFAERDQIADPPFSLVPKGKMLPDKNLFESEPFEENLLSEHLRRECGKCLGKPQRDHLINSGFFETGMFFLHARQKPQANVRRKDFHRVRVKRQDDSRSWGSARRLDHLFQERMMTEVMAVEIPDGSHRIRSYDLVRISAGYPHRRSMKQLGGVFRKVRQDQIGSSPFDRQQRFHHGA